MGLDMNLYKKSYVKNWNHMKKPERHSISIKKEGKAVKSIDTKKIAYVIEELMYWRKANQIHNYFINECNDGVDDCKDIDISEEQLKELLDRCEKVIKASKLVSGKIKNGQVIKDGKWEDVMEDGKYIEDATVADELLPTGSGFFFGSTDYDEWYLKDIIETRDMLVELFKNAEPKAYPDYYYSASW